jgi:hypothetical protein
MARPDKPVDYRLMLIVGVSDAVLGVALAGLALSGILGEGMEPLAVAGGLMALVGVGIVLWARNKISQDPRSGRRQD